MEQREKEENERKREGDWEQKNKKTPRQTHKDTLSTQTSASEHLFSFISPFSSSVLCSPDWLVVKLMLVYRAGKGLKADTSFIACTCQYEEHTDVTFEAFFSPPSTLMTCFSVRETKSDTCSCVSQTTNTSKWEISAHYE